MIDARLLSKTKERLSALDFSEENGRIAEIEAENARMDNAIAEAERRCAEIEALTTKKIGRDPADIADALLEGGLKEAIKAGIDDEALKEERLTLRRAITELRGRQTANFNAIVEVQQSVNGRISDALAPLADALLAWLNNPGKVAQLKTRFAKMHETLRRPTGLLVAQAVAQTITASKHRVNA